MASRPIIALVSGVLIALLAGIGPVPAIARDGHLDVSDEGLSLYFGSATATPSPSPSPTLDEAFDEALELYAQGRWSAAYGRLARLADEGHAEAAGIALLMLSNGPRLYGQPWSASPSQVDHWRALTRWRTDALMARAGD
jgi:hypothetical protein